MPVVKLDASTIGYSAAISACGKSAQLRSTLKLLSQMPRVGLQPNAISYSVAASASEKAAHLHLAPQLLVRMAGAGLQAYSRPLGPWAGGTGTSSWLATHRDRLQPRLQCWRGAATCAARRLLSGTWPSGSWHRYPEPARNPVRWPEARHLSYYAGIRWRLRLSYAPPFGRRGGQPATLFLACSVEESLSAFRKNANGAWVLLHGRRYLWLGPRLLTLVPRVASSPALSAAVPPSALVVGRPVAAGPRAPHVLFCVGLEPGTISYNAAVSGCEKAARWQLAVGLLTRRPCHGLRPGPVSCHAAISACVKAGR
mmetsp:Transcript_70528/g.213487  ORF Transcript_70528/g.213487 Transcript_70528/m.213487 type:complete len:312 (-) Transcript_70528:501-1436(-)